MNRAERRWLATHTLMLDSIREALTEGSVASLVVQDVTDRADLSMGTFYNHFEDKMAAVTAVASLEAELGRRHVRQILGEGETRPAMVTAAAVAARLAQHDAEPGAMAALLALHESGMMPNKPSDDFEHDVLARSGMVPSDEVAWRMACTRGAFTALIRFLVERDFDCDADRRLELAVAGVLGASGIPATQIDEAVETVAAASCEWRRVPYAELIGGNLELQRAAQV